MSSGNISVKRFCFTGAPTEVQYLPYSIHFSEFIPKTFHEKTDKTQKYSKSGISVLQKWYKNGRRRLLGAQSINTKKASLTQRKQRNEGDACEKFKNWRNFNFKPTSWGQLSGWAQWEFFVCGLLCGRLDIQFQFYQKYDIRSNSRSEGKGFLATTILFPLVLKHRKSVRMLYNLTHALAVNVDRVNLAGHSFLACNLLWPGSLIKIHILS